jgi:hypothetical protein
MVTYDEHGQPGAGIHAGNRRARSHDELIGLCKGVIADGLVCDAEARFLVTWFEANPEAAQVWPGKTLAARLAAIWEDGTATPEELADLKELMKELTGLTSQALADLPNNLASQLPLDKPEPRVAFKGRSFCFTGKMVCGPRQACEGMVTERGGQILAGVRVNLDYLVLGLLGSRDWKHSGYGNKILKAIEYKEKNYPLKIISEDTWLKAIDQPADGYGQDEPESKLAGTKAKSEPTAKVLANRAAKAARAEEVKPELLALFKELEALRDTPEFHELGFSDNNPAAAWKKRVEDAQERFERDYTLPPEARAMPACLLQLGLDWQHSKGQNDSIVEWDLEPINAWLNC